MNKQNGLIKALMLACGVFLSGALCATTAGSAAPNKSDDIFKQLNGYWTGTGKINNEKVRCRVIYKSGGNKLKQTMRCSSASGIISSIASLKKSGSRISGSFAVPKHDMKGSVRGKTSKDSLRIGFSGKGIKGSMNVKVKGCRSHSVYIKVTGQHGGSGSLRLGRKKC